MIEKKLEKKLATLCVEEKLDGKLKKVCQISFNPLHYSEKGSQHEVLTVQNSIVSKISLHIEVARVTSKSQMRNSTFLSSENRSSVDAESITTSQLKAPTSCNHECMSQ